ncbi:MAG: exo-alpha-sialidase [Planctomycetota bacterium]|nr:exo-alpha-sialidase [Planctomycetota bacterium]
MYRDQRVAESYLTRGLICLICCCDAAGWKVECLRAESEVLSITVGPPTTLSNLAYQNSSSLAVSRTGVTAAFYPKPGTVPKFYRTSTNGGATWGPEREFSPANAGRMSIALPAGNVLFVTGQAKPIAGGKPGEQEAQSVLFSDDFSRFEPGRVTVFLPNVALHTRWGRFWPPFDKGKIVRLPNGDLLATMYGDLKGDKQYRTMIVRSKDLGRSWRYYSTVAYQPQDPDPHRVGQFCGYCEPSLVLLQNGQLLCVMRTQGTEIPNEYRPLYASWSDDEGKTWSRPQSTHPALMNISPTLAVLDNGVVVCQYGRPGFHVVFSTDNGHTWGNRVSFSHLPEPIITGQFDIVKSGPNQLITIGSDAEGTKVWPIKVARERISQDQKALAGHVVDEQGQPIVSARVQLSPNRYAASDWRAVPTAGGRKPRFAEPFFDPPRICSTPVLAYHSIDETNGHLTVQTDKHGKFQFDRVRLGEVILTVDAPGYAPRHRRVNVAPKTEDQKFALTRGRGVRGQVTDETGLPVAGACVVLGDWHTHTTQDGSFHWSIEDPTPAQIEVKIYKRYSTAYDKTIARVSLESIQQEPLVLRRMK